MLGRKKDESQAATTAPDPQHPQRPGAKNRPTPKRRDQEAARRKPLVETDRKAAAKRDRTQLRAERAKQMEGMRKGEEWALPPRDRGPQRRWLRDFIDARWTLAEFSLPVLVSAVIINFVSLAIPSVRTSAATMWIFSLAYLVILASILEQVVLARVAKRTYAASHKGAALDRGSGYYAAMRAFQFRPLRTPKPAVPRGQHPA